MDPKLQDLYKVALLRHSKQPTGNRKVEKPSHQRFLTNPLCGDEITAYLKIEDGRILSAGFQSQSCSICQASASILMEQLETQTDTVKIKEEAKQLIAALRKSDAPSPYPDSDDRSALFGVKAFRSRIRCATLPWEALLAAIEKGKANED